MKALSEEYLSPLREKVIENMNLSGFSRVTDFLELHRFKSYTLISEFIKDAFPMLLINMQFKEANKSNLVISALKDCMIRYLVEKLPEGWGIGDNSRWQSIRALTNWSTAVKAAGELPEISEILTKISHDLLQNPPPLGWSPDSHGTDPIDAVFNRHLRDLEMAGIAH